MRDIPETIRNLVALSDRPGTEAEGINAQNRAIDLATKNGLSTNLDDYRVHTEAKRETKPPTAYKAPKTTSQRTHDRMLHPVVQSYEKILCAAGWTFVSQMNGVRTYQILSKTKIFSLGVMQIIVDKNGKFHCQHFHKDTRLKSCISPLGLMEYLKSRDYAIEHFVPTQNLR